MSKKNTNKKNQTFETEHFNIVKEKRNILKIHGNVISLE